MRLLLPVLLCACAGGPNPASSPCDDDPRAEPLVVPAAFDGATLQLRVVDVMPDPPTVGDNTWQIAVYAGDAVVTGCYVAVTPTMPDHGHGTTVGEITSGHGVYTVPDLALRMGGYWEIAFTLDCGEAGSDEVLVPVCVDA